MKFARPSIYLITSGDLTPENFTDRLPDTLSLVKAAIESGISLIQIREKNLPARLVFEIASAAARLRQNSNAKILINDRADIALAAGADGVHLPADSIPARVIRKNFPAGFLIGVSTHTVKEAVRAKRDGADLVTFSPIFPTPSKEKYGPPQGTGKLAEVVRAVGDFPVIALGGVDETNLGEAFRAGASGIAAIRLLNDTETLPRIVELIDRVGKDYEQ